jgi:hypothetical protein
MKIVFQLPKATVHTNYADWFERFSALIQERYLEPVTISVVVTGAPLEPFPSKENLSEIR